MENHIKSKDEWKKNIIMGLNPSEFQDLCFDILKINNFENPKPRGKGGDGGRDLEAEFDYVLGKQKIRQKCWFQCKRYSKKTPLNYREFSSELTKAESRGIDRFIVVSNKDMTSDTKSEIEVWNKNHKCQVSDWTGTLFLDLLFESPNICKIYFPDEEIPRITDVDEPQEIIPLSKNLGNRFGIEIEIKTNDIDITNPKAIGEKLKEVLLKLKGDLNLKALIYEKSSMFFFALNQFETSILFLDKSLEITPKNISTLLLKGYILEKLDKLDESNQAYEEILKIDPKDISALNNKGFNLMRKGELREALEYFERVLIIEPKFILSIKNKVLLLKKLKKFREVKELLHQHKNLFEKSTDLMSEEVDLSIEELDLRKAFNTNEEIRRKEPENLAALNNKGVIYERNAQFQKKEKYYPLALKCFDQVIKKDKDYPLGWSNKIAVLIMKADNSEAEEVMDSVFEKFHNNPEVLNKKGILYLKRREPKKAKKYFDSALKKGYKGDFLLNRAKSKLQLRDYEGCLKDSENLLKYEKENSQAWRLKGECIRKLRRGNYQKCFENAEKFRLKPISLLE